MRVVIYGAGKYGANVIDRIGSKHEIVGIVDRDINKKGNIIGIYEVHLIEELESMDYEKIVVCVEGKYTDIRTSLVENGVEESKIVNWDSFLKISPHNMGTMEVDWEKGIFLNDIYQELCFNSEKYSEMEKFFLMGEHNRSFKWLHYFEIYNRHFSKYFGKDITIMEIGVNKGGSLQIWKHMFGPNSRIIGVDINPECLEMEDDQIKIYIGDQEDRSFWAKIKAEIPKVDILIDDGGHYMKQQIVTFEEMFSHVKEDGVYVCEDTGTSYDVEKYNSGFHKAGTWVEYSKNFIDYLHAWFSQESDLEINEYTRSMHSLHYYYGMLVIEKKIMYPPFDIEICNTKSEKYAIPHLRGLI